MIKIFRRWWPEALAVAVAIICFKLAYDFANRNQQGNFLYHYQGLITGSLAVLAAFFTVRQMQVTDVRSEQRHEQLMRLQTRSDKLLVERLLTENYGPLNTLFEEVRDAKMGRTLESSDSMTPEQLTTSRRMTEVAPRVIAVMNTDSWKASVQLFDGTLTMAAKNARSQSSRLRDSSSYASQSDGGIIYTNGKRHKRSDHWNAACANRENLINEMMTLIVSLERMAVIYDVDHVIHSV